MLVLVLNLSFLSACMPGAIEPTPLARAVPAASAADLAELLGGNTVFALDLYQAVKSEANGNLVYSPNSISLVLAMVYAGARGETEQQMAHTLHFSLPRAQLHPTFNALDQELKRRGQGAGSTEGRRFRLNVANALWGQEDYQFLTEFLGLLAANYGTEMRLLDFAREESARQTINDWVSKQTEGRIEELIPPNVLDAATRLVLTNAVYFDAAWVQQFDPRATREAPFTFETVARCQRR